MQDKDFDSLLKRKFEHQDLQSHQEEKWVALSDRLDAFQQQRRRRSMLFYSVVTAALLLGNLAWFLHWLGAFSADHLTNTQSNPVVKRDTLLQTIHIVRYDTIYRTIILENKITTPDQSAFPTNARPADHLAKPELNQRPVSATSEFSQLSLVSEEETNPGKAKALSSNTALPPSVTDAPNTLAQASAPNPAQSILMPLKRVQPGPILRNRHTLPSEILESDWSIDNRMEHQNLSETEANVEGKSSFPWQPMWVNGGNLLFFPGLIEGYVLTTGLQLERNVTKRIALGGSMRLGLASAESSDISRLPSLDNRSPVQKGQGYSFAYWDVDLMPLIQYQLYTQVHLADIGKTRLMAGIGSQWISTLPYSIEYLYINPDTFGEIDLESEKDMETRWQGLSPMLQAERPIGRKMALGARINGLVSLQPLQSVLDQHLGLDFWLKFRL